MEKVEKKLFSFVDFFPWKMVEKGEEGEDLFDGERGVESQILWHVTD